MTRTVSEIRDLLAEIKLCLKNLYGPELMDLRLYGSFARGQANEDSDIDLALILNKDHLNKFQEIDRVQDLIYDLTLNRHEQVSVIPLTVKEYQNGSTPLLHWLKTEGQSL